MSPIIAGRFALERDAQRALEGLRHQGFAPDDVTTFFVEPQAPRAKHSVRNEREPVGVEVHVGAFGQPIEAARRNDTAPEAAQRSNQVRTLRPLRQAGMLVAVRAAEYAKRLVAVNVLQAYGARDVERADGTWIAGKWIDFDPLIPPRLVDPPAACERWISRREPR
ncbi:MAG TPA: hypothetical protein VKG21_04725 [Casimicrobiaceae bacterium]|nr:hypothetical protein [Casimicrobiaceae bacterium]